MSFEIPEGSVLVRVTAKDNKKIVMLFRTVNNIYFVIATEGKDLKTDIHRLKKDDETKWQDS